MTKTILLDCDGVLSNFSDAYLTAFYYETGRIATNADVTCWEIKDCPFFRKQAERMGLSPDELSDRVEKHVIEYGFCRDMQVLHFAQDAVEQLCLLGDVYVLTSPWDASPTWVYERSQWIKTHFPMIGRRRIIHTSQKHMVRGDVFVDDKPANVESWKAAWPEGKAILFGQDHNGSDSTWIQVLEAARG